MKNSKVYDKTNHVWTDSKDITLSLLKNTVIIKAGKEISPSQKRLMIILGYTKKAILKQVMGI
jgi:hypothetical protein